MRGFSVYDKGCYVLWEASGFGISAACPWAMRRTMLQVTMSKSLCQHPCRFSRLRRRGIRVNTYLLVYVYVSIISMHILRFRNWHGPMRSVAAQKHASCLPDVQRIQQAWHCTNFRVCRATLQRKPALEL